VDPHSLLAPVVADLAALLGDNLVGVYLHGSLAMGCFHPATSDMDMLIVLDEDIPFAAKRAVVATLMEHEVRLPGKGIEMSAMQRRALDAWRYPPPFLLHYSSGHTQRYLEDPNYLCGGFEDPDLGAHLTVVYHRGLRLTGEPIAEVFHPIPIADYLAAIWYDLEDIEEHILAEPVYNVLNLCRTLRYVREGVVGSKAEGGAWARECLSGAHCAVAQAALAAYVSGSKAVALAPEQLTDFARYALEDIRAAMSDASTSI
jgi:streptomycin 3"-adenylyltransferase